MKIKAALLEEMGLKRPYAKGLPLKMQLVDLEADPASALELGYAITRRGGTTITGGLPNPKAPPRVPAVTLTAEERTLKGSYIGSSVTSRDISRFLTHYRCSKLPIDRLLSDRISPDDINAGFDKLADGATVRQTIQFA